MKTLVLAVAVFYPLMQGYWEKGPLPEELASAPQAKTYLTDSELKTQTELYNQLESMTHRAAVIRTIALSNNPEAVKTLEGIVRKEENTVCRDDALKAMSGMCDAGLGVVTDTSRLKELFKDQSVAARFAAYCLYLDKTKDTSVILEALAGEDADFIIEGMVPRLAKVISKCNEQQIVKLADSPAASKRAAAAELLALKTGAPDSNQTLKKLADDKDAFVRCRLARGLAARKSGGAGLMKKLSADTLAQVRAEACLNVCAADDQGKADILAQMTADPSAVVRLNAVKSLASAKNSDTILDSIAKCLADDDKYVRAAAEDSYVSLKPDDKQLKKVSAGLDSEKSRASVIRVLGLMNATDFSGKITAELGNSKSDEVIKNAIEALGRMKSKNTVSAICAKADSKNPEIRRAVAAALGEIKASESYPALIKMLKDSDSKTVFFAAESMGKIADKSFAGPLTSLAASYLVPAEQRAAACWAISRLGDAADEKALKQLGTLAATACIPVQMAPPMFDSCYVRASALHALSDLGKNNPAAKKAYDTSVDRIKNPSQKDKEAGIETPLLLEYMRQIGLSAAGEKAEPEQVPPVTPDFAVKKL